MGAVTESGVGGSYLKPKLMLMREVIERSKIRNCMLNVNLVYSLDNVMKGDQCRADGKKQGLQTAITSIWGMDIL